MTNYPDPIYLKETDSTNTFLAQLCSKVVPAELTCVYTSFQTAGRGQRGNHWESEAGQNLLFSFVIYPSFIEAGQQFILAQITALGIQQCLAQYVDHVTIKWPNDIYWNDQKICGTLTENDLTGLNISRSISGSGININQEHFVSDAPNPVSLYQITGKKYCLTTLLKQIMDRIAHHYARAQRGEFEAIRREYEQVLYRREGFHPYRDPEGAFEARFVTIEPIGRIVLEDRAGNIRKYMFKEMEFVL